jgi:UrcA family protein
MSDQAGNRLSQVAITHPVAEPTTNPTPRRNAMSRAFKTTAVALFAALLLVPAAAAQSADQPVSIEVSHADLDLSAKAGAETLLRRMKAASMKVCGQRPSPKLIEATARHGACTSSAMTSAVAAIDLPMVTALFGAAPAAARVATR